MQSSSVGKPVATGQKRVPAGPKGLPLVGNMADFAGDAINFVSRCAREYGDIVPMELAGTTVYLLNNPDYFEQVLVTQNRNFDKGHFIDNVRRLVGNGILTSEGDFWRKQRRLVQPAFHRNRVATYAQVMTDFTQKMLDDWQDGQTRDVHADMMRLTLQIVAKTVFDADVRSQVEDISHSLEVILEENNSERRLVETLLPRWVPTPYRGRYRKALARLDEIVYGLIAERRRDDHDRGDLLSMLLASQDENGQGMDDRQLRDETMTILLAGHETTALALSWTWYLIANNPVVEARLHEELASVLEGRPPTLEDLPRLTYTEMIIKEALRLYPPAWAFVRESIADCEIGGYRLPGGSVFMISPWVIHRDPRFWERPDEFRPERWAEDATAKLPRFAYLPFGGGPRLCIGNSFATMEAALLLGTIAQRYRLSLPPGTTVKTDPTVTLRPKPGVVLKLNAC